MEQHTLNNKQSNNNNEQQIKTTQHTKNINITTQNMHKAKIEDHLKPNNAYANNNTTTTSI